MQNLVSKAGITSFKIWFFALLANTVIGSFILGGFSSQFFLYFFWGAMFGAVSSLPIFFIFWVLLYFLFINRSDYQRIMGLLFMIGILFSLTAFLCFTFYFDNNIGNVFILCVVAIISGIIGIASQTQYIKNICKKRENEFTIEPQSTN